MIDFLADKLYRFEIKIIKNHRCFLPTLYGRSTNSVDRRNYAILNEDDTIDPEFVTSIKFSKNKIIKIFNKKYA